MEKGHDQLNVSKSGRDGSKDHVSRNGHVAYMDTYKGAHSGQNLCETMNQKHMTTCLSDYQTCECDACSACAFIPSSKSLLCDCLAVR
jgi:hypothetical protein